MPGKSPSRRCDGLGARHLVSRARFNANVVVYGFTQTLSTTEVSLRRLHRDVPQEKLNLLKLTAGHMTEAGATAAKIMRCNPRYSEYSRVLFDNMPGDLLGDAVAPRPVCSAHATEQPATRDSSSSGPFVNCLLHPVWNRNGTNVAALPYKVHDRPMVFTALKMIERQVGKLTSP